MEGAISRVIDHARRHGGVVTRAEALALGMAPKTIDRRAKEGSLWRVGPGVLALPGFLDSDLTLLAAATRALPAVVSHESAARLYDMPVREGGKPVVSVPVRRSNRFPGVVVHQLTDLTEEHVTTVGGLPVTTPDRTIIDLAAVVGPRVLARCFDYGVSRGLATVEEMAAKLEKLARKGKPGVKAFRALLSSRGQLDAVPESVLESETLDLIIRCGLPLPDPQWKPPWLRLVNGRVDFAYVEAKVIVEADSRRWHDNPDAFRIDRERDNLAQLAGWRILRFTWDDLMNRPDYVANAIGTALGV